MLALEISGFLFGLAGVWLTIKKNIWCFPAGIVNVLITAYLVYNKTLFADTLQQLVYFVLLVIGWIRWSSGQDKEPLAVSWLSGRQKRNLLLWFLAGTSVMGFIFSNYSRASYPVWDSAATALCFIAQWLIARRKIENWLLWMAANPVYIVLFLLKDLHWYALLSLIYFLLAVAGWKKWNLYYKQQAYAAG